MILDIIIVAIFVIAIMIGRNKGFMYMLIHTLGWIGSLICAVLLSSPLASILENSFVGQWVSEAIRNKLAQPANSVSTAVDSLPSFISGGVQSTVENATETLVSTVTSVILTALSFLLIVLVARLLARHITKPAAQRQSHGLLTMMDRFFGMVAGAIEGLLLIFIFLILVVPVSGFASGNVSEVILNMLNDSHIAGYLYDNNPLLKWAGNIFS